MSDSNTFIDEVTEEVRRDRLFLLLKRYGWIAVLVIILIVGGATYHEFSKARDQAAAQQLGDAIITALAHNDAPGRVEALTGIEAESLGGAAILHFLTAAAKAESGQTEAAVAGLKEITLKGDLPVIYRHIASFKALTLQAETLPAADRRLQFEALAQPGAPLRLLAEEQLALIDIAEGLGDLAIARLQAILQDAEASSDLQQRVAQVIVALGAVPESRSAIQG